jgi:hypothetical protein
MASLTLDDPCNSQGASVGLPLPLQQLLNDITRHCHAECSCDVQAANAVTRDLQKLLQQLVAAIDRELRSNPNCDARTSSNSKLLLGWLVDAINHHFQYRPRIFFNSADADVQSAAAAARGIKKCFSQIIDMLSTANAVPRKLLRSPY